MAHRGIGTGMQQKTFSLKRRLGVAKGKVFARGKGIADVVVSDGFNVVKTGKDGSYSLNINESAEHVFISVPSGYHFPHEKNIVRHYQAASAGEQFNFELEPLGVNDNEHQRGNKLLNPAHG